MRDQLLILSFENINKNLKIQKKKLENITQSFLKLLKLFFLRHSVYIYAMQQCDDGKCLKIIILEI